MWEVKQSYKQVGSPSLQLLLGIQEPKFEILKVW